MLDDKHAVDSRINIMGNRVSLNFELFFKIVNPYQVIQIEGNFLRLLPIVHLIIPVSRINPHTKFVFLIYSKDKINLSAAVRELVKFIGNFLTCFPLSSEKFKSFSSKLKSTSGKFQSMKNVPLSEYLEFMKETAYLAGRLTLGYFNTNISIDYKADDTPVTIADRKAEQLIRARIENSYPGHSIIGEEFGEIENESAEFRWFIDPIDGTKSFINGVPLYSVLIGLEIAGVVQAGVAYFPALDEMLAAGTSLGCWWNGRRTLVSRVDSIERATAVFSTPSTFDEYNRGEEWKQVKRKTYFQAGWGDAYGYLLVATGRVELMLDPIINVWDCAPFPPILSEAGGYFGDWQGKNTIYGKEAMATTRTLLPAVLDITSRK